MSIVGGDGNDSILGGDENDYLSGGKGNDIYFVDATGRLVQERNRQADGFLDHVLLVGGGIEQVDPHRLTNRGDVADIGQPYRAMARIAAAV